MLVEIVKNRILKATFLEQEEKNAMIQKLPKLSEEELNKLNTIFSEMNYEQEALDQAGDFVVGGFMQMLITLNDKELDNG